MTKSHQRSRPWPSNRGSPLEQNGFLSILRPIQRLILLNMSSLNFPVETLRAEQNLPADAEHTLVLTPSQSLCLAPPLSSATPASGQASGRRARPAQHCRARLPPTTSTPPGAACSPASLGSQLMHLTPATSNKQTRGLCFPSGYSAVRRGFIWMPSYLLSTLTPRE